ncbi:M56 family metallopeptidase [Sandarakinorhabdus sp. DWP1-3-1]|uniref:M56 family metallopeptidase n=1 Tax=Sandarakinorhabdus sp. DWP1-3-1 TaxID=2804627 RepID=UPI003CF9D37B
MTALIAWGQGTLLASAVLMVLVLVLRRPARYLMGPRLAYLLWVLPALRLVLPPLPAVIWGRLPVGGVADMTVLFAGPQSDGVTGAASSGSVGLTLAAIWLTGALALLATYAVRHAWYCRSLLASAADYGRIDGIRIVTADVAGPLAFGVLRRCIAVPRDFNRDYTPAERALALAHERAHHARGDLLANWLSLVVLAAHWWNPIAWAAVGAFREDQEIAADAHVLGGRPRATQALYAHVLAKAAGVGALPACNFNARSNLKGRLLMIGQHSKSRRRLALGAVLLPLFGGAALAATAATSPATSGRQAVTIGVKPDGAGSYMLIVGAAAVAPGAPLPGGMVLPADFSAAGGCDLKAGARPHAMAIKGSGTTQTYTVMCGSTGPAPVRATLSEGMTSLQAMRASVASQPASAVFPEAERTHALGAIDRSIAEVRQSIATL